MGAVKLEIRGPQKVNEIGVDPNPNWSFDSLLSELNSLENKLQNTFQSRGISSKKIMDRSSRSAFIMRVSDDEIEDETNSEVDDDEEEDRIRSLVVVKWFNCGDVFLSDNDDSDYEFVLDSDSDSYLMDKVGLVESSLFELNQEHQLGVKEEIRNQISALEMELMRETENSNSAFTRVEKYREARRESDRKFDTQYQRRIAEALDNHLTSIQRDHELKSQIEERKIRSDAAHEEAKRKEKALQEERLRQERARAEAEARRKAEEAKMAALEAERRAAKEAAEKEAAEASKIQAAAVSQRDVAGHQINAGSNVSSQGSGSNGKNELQSAGSIVRAAESALSLEKERLEKLRALEEQNQSLKLSSNMDFSSHERHVARLIKQIRGTEENVRAKSSELLKLCKNPSCPQSISISAFATFAKKVASHSEIPDSAVFACAHVIVKVTSQVPHLMDYVLAEFHRGCIYTVPKHITYSKSAFESKEAYQKTIGYQEEDGKLESTTDYLKRLDCYLRLYGALVQTEVQGFKNSHGPKEGWAWLARFLNNLPANIYTAVALKAFLSTAGFVLFKKYKSQFGKMLNIIYNDFLEALRKRQDSGLNAIVIEIHSYIQDRKFLQEPEGARLQGTLLSHVIGGQPEY